MRGAHARSESDGPGGGRLLSASAGASKVASQRIEIVRSRANIRGANEFAGDRDGLGPSRRGDPSLCHDFHVLRRTIERGSGIRRGAVVSLTFAPE
jgi:hypothetical protein